MIRQTLVITAWLALAALLSAYWIAHAQPNAVEDDPRFTGRSTALDVEGLRVTRRHFEAGARSAWHRHSGGQLLFVAEGVARTQKRGGALREMGQGESDYTAANVLHWHGAAAHSHVVQVAVAFGEDTDWFERVSDAEYEGR